MTSTRPGTSHTNYTALSGLALTAYDSFETKADQHDDSFTDLPTPPAFARVVDDAWPYTGAVDEEQSKPMTAEDLRQQFQELMAETKSSAATEALEAVNTKICQLAASLRVVDDADAIDLILEEMPVEAPPYDPKETFITSVPNEVAMVEQDKQPVVMDVPPRTTFAVRNILTSDEATHMASAVHEFFKLASQGNEESVRTQKEQLFGEIATSYVYSLLKLETRHWDEFRTMLPSLLTNTALGSDGQRDETRKQAIYDTICYWIHGTQPSLPLDATWPSTPPSDDLARSASQDWLVPATDAPSRGGGDTTARPSAYLFHIPQARPTSFALTQPSPLLRYIISPPSRLVTIHRSTLVRSSLIPPSDVTYHDIVAESLTRCKRVAKQTQKANEELVRDRNRTKRELDREINKEWKEVRGILCRPDLVKSAADKILQRVQEPEKAPVQPGSQAVSRRR